MITIRCGNLDFTSAELRAILNALLCAAEDYSRDAARAGKAGADRIEKGFRDMTVEAREIAAKIRAEIG